MEYEYRSRSYDFASNSLVYTHTHTHIQTQANTNTHRDNYFHHRGGNHNSESSLLSLFQRFDRNGSGKISRREFRIALRECGLPATEGEVEDIIDRFSQGGDGLVDFSEFLDIAFGEEARGRRNGGGRRKKGRRRRKGRKRWRSGGKRSRYDDADDSASDARDDDYDDDLMADPSRPSLDPSRLDEMHVPAEVAELIEENVVRC